MYDETTKLINFMLRKFYLKEEKNSTCDAYQAHLSPGLEPKAPTA